MTTEQEFLGNEPLPKVEHLNIPDLKIPSPKPTLGRIVHYYLTQDDARSINARREDAQIADPGRNRTGVMVHIGNRVRAGQVVPAIIVRVWGDHDGAAVNLKCMLDGTDSLWVCSVYQGAKEGSYDWPPRV